MFGVERHTILRMCMEQRGARARYRTTSLRLHDPSEPSLSIDATLVAMRASVQVGLSNVVTIRALIRAASGWSLCAVERCPTALTTLDIDATPPSCGNSITQLSFWQVG